MGSLFVLFADLFKHIEHNLFELILLIITEEDNTDGDAELTAIVVVDDGDKDEEEEAISLATVGAADAVIRNVLLFVDEVNTD